MAAGHQINVRPTVQFLDNRDILWARAPIPWCRSGGPTAQADLPAREFLKKRLTPVEPFRPAGGPTRWMGWTSLFTRGPSRQAADWNEPGTDVLYLPDRG